MGYAKLISYGSNVELFEYEGDIHENVTGSKRGYKGSIGDRNMAKSGADKILESEQKQKKRADNARRATMAFRRLVFSNLGQSTNPLLVSLTYAENFKDLRGAWGHFQTFVKLARREFGSQLSYISVPEFQKRGAIHFHALLWGIENQELARTERQTRLVAGLWGHGYVDVVQTDGSQKLATYLSKYMSKAFEDVRVIGTRAYACSRNIIRPVVIKRPLLTPLFMGGLDVPIDLSTAILLHEKHFMTEWLGKGRFRLFFVP